MEEDLLIQSLDSLWFFCSVFSSKIKPNFLSSEGKTAVEENPEKPISPISQRDQNELTNADFAVETENFGNAVEEAEVRNIVAKKEEKRRRRKRKGRRRVLGEIEWDFGVDLRVNYGVEGKYNGFGGMYGIDENEWVKMPPLSDGMAMKEHIKCWAHAVACTVR